MPSEIYLRTEYHKKRLSEGQKGRKHTEITKKKLSIIAQKRGNNGNNFPKGHKGFIPKEKYKEIGKKISKALIGRKLSEEHKRKISEMQKLHPHSSIFKKGHKGFNVRKGNKHPNWKGGITPENKQIWRSIEMRLWREAVFARDNWTCRKCEIKGGKLHPHHIQNFIKIFGQKIINGEPYLIAQQSLGKKEGDNGLLYFSRKVINRDFKYGAFIIEILNMELLCL